MITIYTRPFCPYCIRAKKLLDSKGLDYREIDSGYDPVLRQEMIERSNGQATYPQIFVDDQHIGGCDDMFGLEKSGKLDQLIASAR